MRFAVLLLAGAIVSVASSARQAPEPFVPVAIDYLAERGAASDAVARDLQSIRALGFNSISVSVVWRDVAPERGRFQFDALDRTLDGASRMGLRAMVRLDHAAPAWLSALHPDGRRTIDPGACFDHPGVRAELQAFIDAASREVARFPALLAIDPGGTPPSGFCLCPHTARRFEQSSKIGAIDKGNYVRISLRDDLKWMVSQAAPSSARVVAGHALAASAAQPADARAQDDWLMSTVVDRYGLTLSNAAPPERVALAFDDLAAAARGKGWTFDAPAPIPATDLRLLAWMALSRGARGLSFADLPNDSTFAGVVTKNPVLFAELEPRQARVAIAFDPLASAAVTERMASVHAAIFRRNIPIDLVHVDELGGALARRYKAIVVPARRPADAAVLKTLAAAGVAIVDAEASSTADDAVIARLAKSGITPEVRLDGGSGLVETRFLESPRVLMLIALNHGATSARVTMTFAPEVQEAIWQNMETGAGVNFIAGPAGPSYSYWFRPKDALVLMIRKDVR